MVLFCQITFAACLLFNGVVVTVLAPRLDARAGRGQAWCIPFSVLLAAWAGVNLLHALGDPRVHDGMDIIACAILSASALVLWSLRGALRATAARSSRHGKAGPSRGRRHNRPRD